MGQMFGNMGGAMALYGLVWLVVVVVSLMALWRGVKAHEAIATQLERMARSLESRESLK
jgi:type II secretory pathway component PulL